MKHITNKSQCLGFALLNNLEMQLDKKFSSRQVSKWYEAAGLKPGTTVNTRMYLTAMKKTPLAGHVLESFEPVYAEAGKYKLLHSPLALFNKMRRGGFYIFDVYIDKKRNFVTKKEQESAHAMAFLYAEKLCGTKPYFLLDTAWKEGPRSLFLSELKFVRAIWEVKFA